MSSLAVGPWRGASARGVTAFTSWRTGLAASRPIAAMPTSCLGWSAGRVDRPWTLRAGGSLPTSKCYAASAAGPSAAERADALIKGHSCVLFGKTTCGFCGRAMQVLQKEGAKVHVYMLDEELQWNEMDEMQDYFKSITGARSVPRVFIDGRFIGGGDDIVSLHQRGELTSLLKDGGAL